MSDLAGEVGSRAGQHWDKLESIFEDRVARALARLGMPAADEVARLQARVEALAAEVAMLRAQAAPGAKAKPAKARKAGSPKTESPKTESPKTKAPKARTAQASKAAKPRARTT